MIPFDVFGRVGIVFVNDAVPSSVVTLMVYVAVVVFILLMAIRPLVLVDRAYIAPL